MSAGLASDARSAQRAGLTAGAKTGALRSRLGALAGVLPGVLGRAALYVALPVALLAAWQAAFALGYIRPILLPPPTRVGKAFVDLAASGDLFRHLGVSLLRVLEGFAIAALVGLPLGIGIGLSRTLDRLTDLIIQ